MTPEEVEALVRRVASETLEAFKQEISFDDDGKPGEAGAFVDKRGAAKLLKCSVGTIDGFARSGRLKRHKVGAKAVRFQRSEVLALISRKRGN